MDKWRDAAIAAQRLCSPLEYVKTLRYLTDNAFHVVILPRVTRVEDLPGTHQSDVFSKYVLDERHYTIFSP